MVSVANVVEAVPAIVFDVAVPSALKVTVLELLVNVPPVFIVHPPPIVRALVPVPPEPSATNVPFAVMVMSSLISSVESLVFAVSVSALVDEAFPIVRLPPTVVVLAAKV